MITKAAEVRAAPNPRARLVLRRSHLIALALVVPLSLVGFYASTNVKASLSQRALRAHWSATMARGPLDPVAISSHSFAQGEPVARIAAAGIGLDVIVVEGGNGHRGPAHLPSSVAPGLEGVSIVSAGRFGYGNFFLGLDRLVPGDTLLVQTLAGERRFRVTSIQIVPAASVNDGSDSQTPVLLLVGPARAWGSDERIVVRAESGGSS